MRRSPRASIVGLVVLLSACGGESAKPPEKAPPTPTLAESQYARCAICHQKQGEGMRGAYRPLAGSRWATGSADRVIAMLIHGVQGPVRDSTSVYTSAMLPYGTGVPLTDEELAAVLTLVRTSWGNTASPISAADVARVRDATKARVTPYTQSEIDAMR